MAACGAEPPTHTTTGRALCGDRTVTLTVEHGPGAAPRTGAPVVLQRRVDGWLDLGGRAARFDEEGSWARAQTVTCEVFVPFRSFPALPEGERYLLQAPDPDPDPAAPDPDPDPARSARAPPAAPDPDPDPA